MEGGLNSTAAGLYQFTEPTWKEYGGGPMTPWQQDRYAWELARKQYYRLTKRNLQEDLEGGGLNNKIMDILSPRWQIFKNQNRKKHINLYQESLKRYRGINE